MTRLDNLLDVLTVEVEQLPDPAGLTYNLVSNPSGDLAGINSVAGWSSSEAVIDSPAPIGATRYLRMTQAAGGYGYGPRSSEFPVTAGQWLSGNYQAISFSAGVFVKAFVWVYDAAGALLVATALEAGNYSNLVGVHDFTPIQLPAGAASANVQFYTSGQAAAPQTVPPVNGLFLWYRTTIVTAPTQALLGPVQSNLITNPSFETNTTGWSSINATLSSTTSGSSSSGTKYLKVLTTGTASQKTVIRGPEVDLGASGFDKPWELTANCIVADGSARTLKVEWQRFDRSVIGTTSAVQSPSSKLLTFRGAPMPGNTAPNGTGGNYLTTNGARYAVPIFEFTGSSIYYLDSVMFRLDDGIPTAYFDGSTAASTGVTYAWSATAHGSTSTKSSSKVSSSIPPVVYTPITGSAVSISSSRRALDGSLGVTIRDAALDPARTGLLRPGRRCRVLVTTDPNLVPNGLSFGGSNGTLTREGVGAGAGGAYKLLTTSTTTVNQAYLLSSSAGVPVPVGNTVSFSVWAKGNGGVFLQLYAVMPGGNASFANSERVGLLDSEPWKQITLEGVVPATATGVYVVVRQNDAGARRFWIDRPRLEDRTDPGPVEELLVGKIEKPTVTYDLKRKGSRPTISLSVYTPGSELAQTPSPDGVAAIAQLPYLLQLGAIPWYIIGAGGDGVARPAYVSTNESATLLDQVQLTRDSVSAFALVDRRGVLRIGPRTTDFYGGRVILDESIYSDLKVSFDPTTSINTVTVIVLRYNATTKETEEVTYGPYVDVAARKEWGVRSAEYRVHGVADPAAFANTIIAANKAPKLSVESLRIPIRTTEEMDWSALLDLYSMVTIRNVEQALEIATRITSVSHSIDSRGRWYVDLGFTTSDSTVEAPASTTPLVGSSTSQQDGVWNVVTAFSNLWSSYGGSFAPVAYMRKNGIVYLKGMVRNGTINTLAFTLPAGFRPKEANYYPMTGSGGNSIVSINGLGQLVPVTGTNAYVTLSGLSFPAEV